MNSEQTERAPQVNDTWYRYEGYVEFPGGRLTPSHYFVSKVTPRGVWLRANWDYLGKHQKFALLDATKRWAYPTVAEALTSYIRRKQRQMSILSRQAQHAEDSCRTALNLQKYLACPDCRGTCERDSGGAHPWGSPILVPCDHSAMPPETSSTL